MTPAEPDYISAVFAFRSPRLLIIYMLVESLCPGFRFLFATLGFPILYFRYWKESILGERKRKCGEDEMKSGKVNVNNDGRENLI